MPEAHVEVIKLERGSEGRRAGGSGGRRERPGLRQLPATRWEPRPFRPEKVVCNN